MHGQTEDDSMPREANIVKRLKTFFIVPSLPDGLTKRKITKDILKIVWPSGLELMLSSLASMVDMMMVGQLGAWAVSAVAITTQPKFIFMAIYMALNSGATAMVARFKGAQEQEDANTTMRQAIVLTAILCIVISAIGYVSSGWMIKFMGAQSDTMGPATTYLQIQMIGLPFMAMTMVVTAVLRGVGNTRASMVYNIVSNVLNIILNYLLIYGNFGFPKMGVAGASLATIIGQFVAFIMAGITLFRGNQYLRIKKGDSFRLNPSFIKRIVKIGGPAMLEQIIMRVGMLLYVLTVTALGTVPFATHNIVMSILNLSFMNGQAFGIAATTLIGQNIGAKRLDYANAYVRQTRRLGMMVSLFLAVIFFFFGRQIVGLYTTLDAQAAQIIDMGGKIMMIVALIQPLQSSQLILNGALRGAGDTRSTAIIMFFGVLIVRPLASYAFIHWFGWGLLGAWAALAIDQVVRSTLSYIRFQMGNWMYIRV